MANLRKSIVKWIATLLVALMALASLPGMAAASAHRYPVIFVPGIGGTELYNENDLVWINQWKVLGSQIPVVKLFNMSWLMPLRLKPDGATPYNPWHKIRTGDVMRANLTDAYSGLLSALRKHGYVEGKDLRVLPYDWRRDPVEAADQLGRLVDKTLQETGARQVVLIGHSMGGLVARDYVVRGGAPNVKATMSLATPWLGAPMAYRALEYGWDLGIKLPGTKWSVMAPKDVKVLTQNYPVVYALSPSRTFFDQYAGGYITRNGKALTYEESLEKALAPHNRGLAAKVPSYQARLLDGNDYGVQQFILAGKGSQTLVGITERTDWLGITQKTERFADGDEVVPLYSADLGYSRNPGQANRYIGKVAAVAYAADGHTLFAQSGKVQGQVMTWLTQLNTK